MVLISNGKSTKANGYLDRTLEQLSRADVEAVVFDKIMENPVKEVIMEGAAFAKENGCDFIVALDKGQSSIPLRQSRQWQQMRENCGIMYVVVPEKVSRLSTKDFQLLQLQQPLVQALR